MLCIVDNALESFAGHHFEYVRCLYECAKRRNEPVLVLGHRRADKKLAGYFQFEGVFRRSHYDFPTTIPILRYPINPLVQNYQFYKDLKSALAHRCTPDWLVFAPTMNHNHTLGWARWLNTLRASECPTVVLFVRNSYCDKPDPAIYDKRAYFALLGFKWLERLSASGRKIHLVTDSERLVREFSRLTRLPIAILPTPHTDRVGRVEEVSSPIKLVWLGGIRKEKDFSTLARAIVLLDSELRQGCIKFVIQSNLDDPYDTETEEARERLKAAALPNVTLIERPLSGEEYSNLLFGSGAVVIPRMTQFYRARTSGIFVEALSAGKPVVVTGDTWMSDQLKRYGAGVVFADQDPAGLADAIRELVSKYKEFRRRAEQGAREWSKIHNPDSLYDMLQMARTNTMKGL